MSRRTVDEVLRLNESHGFLRGLVAVVGFPQTSVVYDRDERATGSGKYNRFTGSIRIGLNGIVGFSRYPLQIITIIGFITFAFAMLLALTYLVLRLAGIDIVWGNPTLVMIVSFFSGIQLLSLGVIGEYVGRIYDEVKRRPIFVVDVLEGFERPLARLEDGDGGRGRRPAPLLGPLPLGRAAAGPAPRRDPRRRSRHAARRGRDRDPEGDDAGQRAALPRPRDGAAGAQRARGRIVICRGHLGEAIEDGLGDGAALRARDRLLRRGPGADRHRRAPCAGRCRCSATASS